MAEYTVIITEMPLGINFVVLSDTVDNRKILLDVVENDSIGDNLGLSIGDELIAINDKDVSNLTIQDICTIFNEPRLPLHVTFEEYELSSDDEKLFISQPNASNSLDAPDTPDTPDTPDSELDTSSVCSLDDFSPLTPVYTPKSEISTDSPKLQTEEYSFDDNEDLYYVSFDKVKQSKNNNVLSVSSNGLKSGYYEWSFEILTCDVFLEEIGVVSVCEIDNIEIGDKGVKEMKELGARAVFGNELATNLAYYGSYNENDKQRCYKELTNKIGWCTGDVLTVCLDLDCYRIRFLLNGNKVRKAMSLEPNKTYYPFISFTGNCKFSLISSLHRESD